MPLECAEAQAEADRAGTDRSRWQEQVNVSDKVNVVVIGMTVGGEEVAGRLTEAGLSCAPARQCIY